ncbi:MAG: LuxR family transcriptional regulator, partial [Gordonibacter sp.]
MRIDTSATDNFQEPVAELGKSALSSAFNRSMLLDSLGLACYIAWSFVFWNGSLLFGDLRPSMPVDNAQNKKGVLTAHTAMLRVFYA